MKNISANSVLRFTVALFLSTFISGFTNAQTISTFAGGSWAGDGGMATHATLKYPGSVCVDSANNIYVSENSRIRKISPSGTITTIAGTGIAGELGDGGPATLAQVINTWSGFGQFCMAMDHHGNIYFSGICLIRKINSSGIVTTYAGNGTFGYSGDGGPCTAAQISFPMSMCVDKWNSVYFLDGGNQRIRKIDSSGTITTIAGNGLPSDTLVALDGRPATSVSISFDYILPITCDSGGNVYFANHSRIVKRDLFGVLHVIAGTGAYGSGGDGGPATAATLLYPVGLAFDKYNRLHIANGNNIRRVDASGTISTIAGHLWGFGGDGGAATAATFNSVYGIVFDTSGNLIVGDYFNNRLRKISTAGIISTFAGGYYGDGNMATDAAFVEPAGMAQDRHGNVYIADQGTGSIRKISVTGAISTIAGKGVPGFGGDGGPATAALLKAPVGLVVDSAGAIIFTDGGNHRIRKIDTSGIITTIAGTGAWGFSGDGGAAVSAEMYSPVGICLDRHGNIVFADGMNARVRKIDASGIISTIVGNGSSISYSADSLDGVVATDTGISGPAKVGFDKYGNLYVSAGFYIFRMDTGGLLHYAMGQAGGSGDCNPVRSAQVYSSLFCIDTAASFYLAGPIYTNDFRLDLCRVRKTSATGIIETIAGHGVYGYSGDGGCALDAAIGDGDVLLINNASALLFSDIGNGIIRREELNTNHRIHSLHPGPVTIHVCRGATSLLDSGLAVIDSDIGQNLSFSVLTVPSHGTISIPYTCAVSTGGICYPTGFCYISLGTYLGNDTFSVIVWDGFAYDTVNVIAVITAASASLSISSVAYLCTHDSLLLSATIPGGAWGVIPGYCSSCFSVDGTGELTALGGSSFSMVSYAVNESCGTLFAEMPEFITPYRHSEPIEVPDTLCTGVSYEASCGSYSASHSWRSSSTSVAVVDSFFGVVNAISPGTDTIYLLSYFSCGTDTVRKIIHVIETPMLPIISGSGILCIGSPVTFSASVSGGHWSSSDHLLATISSTGLTTGVSPGIDSIFYSVGNSCASFVAVVAVSVVAPPNAGAISGVSSLCAGSIVGVSTTGTTGGSWTSSSTALATVAAGVVTAVSAGSDTISYTVTNGCGTAVSTHVMIINPLPVPGTISGVSSVCAGSLIMLTESATGGTWSSGTSSVATVSGGVVTGLTSGTSIISYAVTNICGTAYATHTITVNPLPDAGAISGTSSVCAGSLATLTESVGTGTWSSSSTSLATVSGGVVSALAAGSVTISYTVSNACGTAYATHSLTVNPLPIAGVLSGSSTVCVGTHTTLTDTTGTGIWTSGSPLIATVSAGVVSGVAVGTAVISYAVTNVCGTAYATHGITVNPLPVAGTLSGSTSLCQGSATTLTSSISGGAWSSSATSVASVSGGIVSGISAGTSVISYAVTNSCGTAYALDTITVNPLPDAGTITGPDSVCAGDTIYLSDAVSGGTWTSGFASIATVSSTGQVIGTAAGAVSISYTYTNVCGSASATHTVYVRPASMCGTSVAPVVAATQEISLYPNPNNGSFTISLPPHQAPATITIMDMSGKVLREVTNDHQAIIDFNITDIAAGVYLVKIHVNGLSQNKKVVIY